MSSTRIHRHVKAPRALVYRALLDARAVAQWRVPTGMTSHVHAFEAREGGAIRVSLTYDAPTAAGKTSAHTDTYHGRFVKLVPDELVVEALEFETADPALRGEMTITFALSDADGGTDIFAVHDGLPSGVPIADNELGWRLSLGKLAALVEAGRNPRDLPLSDAQKAELDRRLDELEAEGPTGLTWDEVVAHARMPVADGREGLPPTDLRQRK